MPKRGKEPRPSSRHSSGRFSPPPPPRQSRNDYQVPGPSHSTSDSSSGRRSPHSNDNIKISNGNSRHGNNSNRMLVSVVDSPIILTDDDDDYKNLDTSVNIFREAGNKMKPDTSESTGLIKHFVPSADRYHIPQSAPEKPMFRGPETDVLHDLEKDKLKNIRVQMIRADVQQNESFRKAYVIEEPVASRSKGEKNHQTFEAHFNSTQMHYENNDKNNYGLTHSLSPSQVMSRDRSLSPRIGRPPSPPLPYSPERDHFNPDSLLRRERSKRSLERNVHERPPRPEHFIEQHKMENFSSGLPPEPRSPDMQRFRPSDHSRHRMKDVPVHYEERSRRSGSPPEYFENHYTYRSPSPTIRPYSPNHQQMPMSPPPNRDLSSPPLRDRPSHSSDRSRRRRTPTRHDRSRDRRRRISPRRRTPPSGRSPIKRRNENGKSRTLNKNQEPRKREPRGRRNRRSQSKSKSSSQEQQLTLFQQPQPQPLYPPPPPGVVRLPPPPRPYPPGPMMIPMRPPPFPPSMGPWRPARPPMQPPPPSGWPYPRPRPFYFPY